MLLNHVYFIIFPCAQLLRGYPRKMTAYRFQGFVVNVASGLDFEMQFLYEQKQREKQAALHRFYQQEREAKAALVELLRLQKKRGDNFPAHSKFLSQLCPMINDGIAKLIERHCKTESQDRP